MPDKLTHREREIAALLAQGMNDNEIASTVNGETEFLTFGEMKFPRTRVP
jgi:hypothetical protein